jgi:hypothetical protein
LLRGLPVLLLVAVAAAQLVLARSEALNPWSGGGFGMFSTLDHASRRHLHAFLLRPGLRREIVPPRALEREVSRLLTLPSRRRLRALADALADTPVPDHGPPLGVQVQVWSTRFDPETLTPSSAILRELVSSVEPGD